MKGFSQAVLIKSSRGIENLSSRTLSHIQFGLLLTLNWMHNSSKWVNIYIWFLPIYLRNQWQGKTHISEALNSEMQNNIQ